MDSQTSLNLLAKIQQEKQASTPAAAAAVASSRSLRNDALKDMRDVALWSLGIGAAGRGGVGLYNLLRRNLTVPQSTTHQTDMPLPFAVEGEQEEEKSAAVGDSFLGSPVTKKESLWFYYPGMLLGGLAAGYGGWKAVDHVLDKRRRASIDDELEAQKSKFRKALLASYDRPFTNKQAEDEDTQLVKLGQDLDNLFDLFEKAAGDEMEKQATMGDVLGTGAGMYATYAIPAALLAGYAAYSAGKKRQRKVVLDKALKARARRRSMQSPAPIFATPVPVSASGEEEENVG